MFNLNTQKIKYIITGIIIGATLSTSIAFADLSEVKLIINGKQIQSDVAPQMINGRVFVPVRLVSENLGANVKWDNVNNSVIIDSCGIGSSSNMNDNGNINNTQPQKQNNINDQSDNIVETTYNGIKAIKINDETYFCDRDYSEIITWSNPRKGKYSYNDKTKLITINIYNKNIITLPITETIRYKNNNYIPIKYYIKY